jgi:hypothetical protein
MIHGDEFQPCPAKCFNGYTTLHAFNTRNSRMLCPSCDGKGYLIHLHVGMPQPTAPIPAHEDRSRIQRTADRLEAGLCMQCGEEPLLGKSLGARCMGLKRLQHQRARHWDAEIG